MAVVFLGEVTVVSVLDSSRSHEVPEGHFTAGISVIVMVDRASERTMRGPAVGRKNDYGSNSEWGGQLATMLFSVFATLSKWKINPRTWLRWYLNECANAGGKVPIDVGRFLPWNLSSEQRKKLGETIPFGPMDDGLNSS